MGGRVSGGGASTAFVWGEAPVLCLTPLLSQARGPASNPRRASCGAGGATPSTTSLPPLRGVDATSARQLSYSIDILGLIELRT